MRLVFVNLGTLRAYDTVGTIRLISRELEKQNYLVKKIKNVTEVFEKLREGQEISISGINPTHLIWAKYTFGKKNEGELIVIVEASRREPKAAENNRLAKKAARKTAKKSATSKPAKRKS